MMLVPYRKDYRKIILGILSFIPGLHDYDRVAEEVDWSLGVGNPIYLWQNDENGDFSGAAIVELGPEYVLIRRISFLPSERSGKNVYAFLTALHQKYANRPEICQSSLDGNHGNAAFDYELGEDA